MLLPILFSSWLLGLLLPVGSLVPGEDFQSVAFGAFNNSCFTNKPSVDSTCTAVHQVENQMQFALRNGNIKRFFWTLFSACVLSSARTPSDRDVCGAWTQAGWVVGDLSSLRGFLPYMGPRRRGRVAISSPVVLQPAPSASSVCGRDLCCFALGFVAAILVISILLWPDVHVDQL